MQLTIKELNEIIYALGVAEYHGMFVNDEVNLSAGEKIRKELNRLIEEEEKPKEETTPIVKKANFPGTKKSNLTNPEK